MQRTGESSSWHRPGISIGATLLALILSVLLPILVAEFFIYSDRFERRVRDEHNANLEMARVFGMTFERLVQDILRQESAIAVFLTGFLRTSKEAQKILEDSSRDYDFILDFNWVNPEGRIEASSSPNFVGVDLSDRSFLREMVSGSDWVVSDLMRSKSTGEPIFVICRAMRNVERALLGFVVARIVPEKLDPVLAFERFRQGTVSLLDSRGVLVYSYPNVQIPWEERNSVEPRLSLDPDKSNAAITAGAPIKLIGWSAKRQSKNRGGHTAYYPPSRLEWEYPAVRDLIIPGLCTDPVPQHFQADKKTSVVRSEYRPRGFRQAAGVERAFGNSRLDQGVHGSGKNYQGE